MLRTVTSPRDFINRGHVTPSGRSRFLRAFKAHFGFLPHALARQPNPTAKFIAAVAEGHT
jgi:hypothetical protein